MKKRRCFFHGKEEGAHLGHRGGCGRRGNLQEGAKTITFVINGKDASRSVEIHTDREYLGEALADEKLVEGTESEYGLFVTTVDGYTADDSVQEWWCFSKGGEDLSTGVDTTPIADGDTFEATLKTGW